MIWRRLQWRVTAPYLLMFGGVFMQFLFCHWLFAEKENRIMPGERFLARSRGSFYAVIAVLLLALVWETLEADTALAFAAVAVRPCSSWCRGSGCRRSSTPVKNLMRQS
ncbi:MAG: hypothetical protein MJ014_01475 [Methanocorpusculum sp.]|nr:hypothetical protein [Methanocorpusculum sp.]